MKRKIISTRARAAIVSNEDLQSSIPTAALAEKYGLSKGTIYNMRSKLSRDTQTYTAARVERDEQGELVLSLIENAARALKLAEAMMRGDKR